MSNNDSLHGANHCPAGAKDRTGKWGRLAGETLSKLKGNGVQTLIRLDPATNHKHGRTRSFEQCKNRAYRTVDLVRMG